MPTSSWNKFNSFVEDVAEGVHNLQTGALTVALCAAANAPIATNTVLANLTQISYTNVVTTPSASRVIGLTSSAQTTGTYKLVLPDMTITATGGAIAAFRYVVIYNDTPTSPADPLIAWLDYGADVTLATGESLLIDFDGTNGVFTLA
jgi:hypothetical protein